MNDSAYGKTLGIGKGKRIMNKLIWILGICCLLGAQSAHAAFTEPVMADYTAIPVIMAETVKPNIMIALDNSGSMNGRAYGDDYYGEGYEDYLNFPVILFADDWEEATAAGVGPDNQLWDFDMGEWVTGLRFQNITIPQGSIILDAYIEFVARDSDALATNLLIEGEASDNALPFDTNDPDTIKSRISTANTVNWNGVAPWSSGDHYDTPSLTNIVQEIVDRPGWASSNAMVFRITGSGERDATPRDDSSTYMPILHIKVAALGAIRYYGYFNPDYFYTYGSSVFEPAYKKNNYDHDNSVWNVEALVVDPIDGELRPSGNPITLNDSAIVSQGLWDGNFANWVSMRRVDVLRKVIMGGKATSRTGGGNQTNIAEAPANNVYAESWDKWFDSTGDGPAVSPFNDQGYTYLIDDGNVTAGGTNHTLRIQKYESIEPQDFFEGNISGVLQRVGDKARWGNMWFNRGDSGGNNNGGYIQSTIDANPMATMLTNLQNQACNTSTPLAETFYVAMQYFRQEDVETSGYPNNVVPNNNDGQDPYYFKDEDVFIECAKSFLIMLTDGAPTRDGSIPSTYQDYDDDSHGNDNCAECSSNALDDLALWAHTNDLRPDSDSDGLPDDQNLTLYAIYAFDDDPAARELLRDAARNGGFDDQNGNGRPDGTEASDPEDRLEWDQNGDGDPDTYFEANDGFALEAQLLKAITDILERASSGTAASVLATSNQGAGNSVQSYYRATKIFGVETARWLGYMQSLWVDPWGNLREDTNENCELDLRSAGETSTADGNVDMIVQLINDGDDVKVRRWYNHYLYNSDNIGGECTLVDGDGEPDSDCELEEEDYLEEDISTLLPLFEAGQVLATAEPTDRKIFTYIGESGVVANEGADGLATISDNVDESGDVIYFNTGAGLEDRLAPFLGVSNDTAYGVSGLRLGVTHGERVTNIIDWIRGTDVADLRNRTLDGVTWPLGDIVNSTPIVVGPAREYYHLLYGDEDYLDFIAYAQDRETMIYLGANDGMMHAFTNHILDTDIEGNLSYVTSDVVTEPIGTELWAYIPQAVLPHLKWTASYQYTHTYYLNGEPRVFDAKILPDDKYYIDDDGNPNYGTFMVFGLNMGGKTISVNEDFGGGSAEEKTFSPTYVMMDITDPRNPRLMWERSYTGMGMSSSVPAPVRVGPRNGNSEPGKPSKWFLVFGSGPSDYDHVSDQSGHIFVVDMITGEPYRSSPTEDWIWESTNNSYFNDPLALDVFQSNNTDAIYLAENYYQSNKWVADVYKIVIPCSQCIWDEDEDGVRLYDKDELVYNEDPSAWQVHKFFESEGPVSVKLNAAIDPLYNELLYFGTGRILNEEDKSDDNQQYLYCVKDPFYNKLLYEDNYYHDFNNVLTLDRGDLLNSDAITVTSEGNVSGYTGVTEFWPFVERVREDKNGWYVSLLDTDPSERIITQTILYGGIFVTPTFTPTSDLCSMGGHTGFLGGYYETGTGFTKPIFYKLEADALETDISIRHTETYVGMPPTRAIVHDGLEGGTKITIQLSTGEFLELYGRTAYGTDNGTMEEYESPGEAFIKETANPACKWQNY